MEKKRINILCRKDINGALNRYITSELFESRIMEHPQQALERTSFHQDARISTEKK
jgi:hypothetical protein